jgi:molecular chaperone Hsp33
VSGGPAAAVPDDLVQPFQIESARLRGRLIRLGPVVDTILRRHAYPAPVAALLGEALTLCATLASALKFDGVFTLQTKGDGPVSMMVADWRSPGELRGYASFDAAKLAAAGASGAPVPRLLGAGHLALTVDQGPDTERYQGIVELAGATLADCAHAYFRQSEQLEAGIRLAIAEVPDATGAAHWRAAGLMLQRLPPNQGNDADAEEDAWRRALTFLGTVRDNELTDPHLAPNTLLFRLFHEDGVRVFDATNLAVGCRCSRERIGSVLRSFPVEELREMELDGRITVTCEFCNKGYEFTAEAVAAGTP